MTFSLTVLGSDGSYPGPGRAASGYLVRAGDSNIWVDCGSGTLAALQTHIAIADVDGIIVTHEHPDHRSDIEGFAVACTYVSPREPVPVYAPEGVRRAGYHTHTDALQWHVVGDGDEGKIGKAMLRFSRTDHPPETLAVRIEYEGRSFVYSADTGPGWSLSELGPPADLALVEATFPAGQEMDGHLSGTQAGRLARLGGVRHLIVTHQWPTVDAEEIRAEAEAEFGASVDLATPGRTWPI